MNYNYYYFILIIIPLCASQQIDDDDYQNYIEFTGYNSMEDCLNQNNSIINNTYMSSLKCGCFNKKKCINEILDSENFKNIQINFNNSFIYLHTLKDKYICNCHNKLYYQYKLEYEQICPINLIALLFTLIILLCMIMCIIEICIEQKRIKKNRLMITTLNMPPPYYDE